MKRGVLSNFYFQSYLLNLVLIFSFLFHGGRSYDVVRYYLLFSKKYLKKFFMLPALPGLPSNEKNSLLPCMT
jgi:hypothetical protein